MKRAIEVLQSAATGRTVLILLLLTNVVYLVILLGTIPSVLSAAPGMRLFDMSPSGYSADYAKELLDSIGPTGRHTYLTLQLPVDLLYPALFGVTYTLLLTWLFGKAFSAGSPLFFLVLVPALAALFDYLENGGILAMLLTYPDISPTVVRFASAASVLKSAFTVLFYLLLLGGALSIGVKKLSR